MDRRRFPIHCSEIVTDRKKRDTVPLEKTKITVYHINLKIFNRSHEALLTFPKGE